eukprot:XP_001707723.1 Hypothetical protein GL50803_20688 [Giardia lamblia ATCC 50803]
MFTSYKTGSMQWVLSTILLLRRLSGRTSLLSTITSARTMLSSSRAVAGTPSSSQTQSPPLKSRMMTVMLFKRIAMMRTTKTMRSRAHARHQSQTTCKETMNFHPRSLTLKRRARATIETIDADVEYPVSSF